MGRYLDLLKAKKNENRPPTDATKPTKPPETEQSDSFVGFVAYPSPHFEKNDAVNDATAKPDSATAIPEQSDSFVGFVAYPSPHFEKNDAVNDATAKPDSATAIPEQSDSFVGFVAYPSPHFEKNEGELKPTDTTTAPAVDWHQAHAAYQRHHITCPICIAAGKGYGSRCDEGQRLHAAYEAAPMPEFGKTKRVTPAPLPPAPQTPQPRMTPRSEPEIVRMIGLHRRALAVGLPNNSATGKVLDELMDTPDMGSCFACRHLRGAEPERWRCAGHGHDLAGLPLAHDWVAHLHRCDGYQPPPEGTT